MKKVISSSQKDIRLIHLTIDAVARTAGGEDARLVQSVEVVGDVVTVKLTPKAKARGGRALGIVGYVDITGGEKYTFTGSNTEDIIMTAVTPATHGSFGITVIANDYRHLYEA